MGCFITSAQAPIHLRLRPAASEVIAQPDGAARVRIRLHMEVDPGWHTFPSFAQINTEGLGPAPLEISLSGKSALHLVGRVETYPTLSAWDAGYQMPISVLENQGWVEVVLQADKGLRPGLHEEVLLVNYQVCRDRSCLPPAVLEVPISFSITPGGSKLQVASAAEALNESMPRAVPPNDTPPAKGLWASLWLALLAGAGALLTPCVFPMVPITVSIFLQRAERQGRRPLADALIYGLGIVVTFSGLGLILAALFGASGVQSFATSPWVNLSLVLLFVGFALNLFGAFELRAPSWLLNRMGARAHGGNALGLFMMGLTFSVTSFTCTVPFVGSALVSAAHGKWFYPLLGMAGFSTIFALPFVALALFPSVMKRLPKGGEWMNHLKVVLGFIEVAAAVKFFSNADLTASWRLLPRERVLVLWMACSGLISLYLLGVFRLSRDQDKASVGGLRLLTATAFSALTLFFGSGLLGGPLGEWEAFLPPASMKATQPSNGTTQQVWLEDYSKALEAARQTGKPLFIDFTGTTCTNCRWMEQNMFSRPRVAQLMDGFVRARLFTDRRHEPDLSHQRLQQERFGSVELPLYAILTPEGRILGTSSFTRDEGEFIAFLNKGATQTAAL